MQKWTAHIVLCGSGDESLDLILVLIAPTWIVKAFGYWSCLPLKENDNSSLTACALLPSIALIYF